MGILLSRCSQKKSTFSVYYKRGEWLVAQFGPNIYDYLDPVLFLNDYFDYRKMKNPHFSQRMFAQKADIKSSGFICDVLKGRRALTVKQVENFLKGMDLKTNEEAFFRGMVSYAQAKNHEARMEWRQHLEKLQPSPMKRLNKVVAEYYKHWYHIAVRESLALFEFKGEFEEFSDQLSRSIFPKIKKSEALSSLEFLFKNGFIVKNSLGIWSAKHKSLTAGSSELGKAYLRGFQGQMMDLAKDALETVTPDQRNISCTTMSISSEGMKQIQERISNFHNEIVQLVQKDFDEDKLYQFNVQFFPVGGNQNEIT